MRIAASLATVLTASLVLAGCQRAEQESQAPDYPSGPVTMTAGATPGSGFDLTIRAVVDALKEDDLVDVELPVRNRPGGSGADFLATMVEQERGRDDQLSVTSLSMMMNQLRGASKYGYDDVTMIARLTTEYFVVVTRPDSPLRNLNDLMAAIKADPRRVPVGAAHDDEAPFDLLVSAAGGDPAATEYVTEEGGGDQTAALLDGSIGVAIGGVSEFTGQIRSGGLKALGVLSEAPLPGLDAETARAQGLDVTLSNWRGIYGPPEMPDAAAEFWRDTLAAMVTSPAWREIAERNRFTTTFMVGEEFQTFLADTQSDLEAALQQAGR